MNKPTRVISLILISLSILANLQQPGYAAKHYQNYYSIQISRNYNNLQTLIDQGKFENARNICEDMLRKNPNDLVARNFLGSIYASEYKLEAAQREFKKVLAKNPKNASAHNGLGAVYYKKTTSSNMEVRRKMDKYYDIALQEFNDAIRYSPNYYIAYNNAAKVYQETGRLDDAEKNYRKALDIEPKYSDAVEGLGSVYFAKNQVDAAIEKYKEAIALNTKNSSAHYKLGEAYTAKGDYNKAINALQTSLYLYPNSAPVHDMLGKAYEMQGNEAAGISEYKKATLIKPEYTAPYIRLSELYQNRGDDEFAISELKSSISVNPNFLEGKLKIADISLDAGKTDQAIKYYKEVQNDPNYSSQALKGLSRAYFTKAQEVNSRADLVSESEYINTENALRQAIDYNPNDIELYLGLMRMSRLSNNDDQTRMYMSKIINAPANTAIAEIVKGEAFMTNNQFSDAHNEFKNAIGMAKNTDDMLNIGDILIMNRAYPAAKEAFNAVLQRYPNNARAKRSLERIQKNEDLAESKFNVGTGFYKDGQKMAAIEALRDCLSYNPYYPEAQLLIAKCFENQKYYYNAVEHYTAYIHLATMQSNDIEKYEKKIQSLNRKISLLEKVGKPPKRFTRV